MNTSKACNSSSITLRLNKQEKIMLDRLVTKYKIKRKSSFIKQILFNIDKPTENFSLRKVKLENGKLINEKTHLDKMEK